MSVQMVSIDRILPNPYRKIDAYDLSESKIESLIASYANTGFWDGSIQARPHSKKQGYVEIAFGHHRVEAAKRADIKQLGLVVADRTNAQMILMMADENREEFRSDARVTMETIAVVIEAYGRGEIELEWVPADTRKDNVHVLPGGNRYTLTTVARFLGWTKRSDGQATSACRSAFEAYLMRDATTKSLSKMSSEERTESAVKTVTTAARMAGKEARRAGMKSAEVKRVEQRAAERAVEKVREQETRKNYRGDAKIIAKRAVLDEQGPKKKGPAPEVEFYINAIVEKSKRVSPYGEILDQCRRLVPYLEDIDAGQLNQLVSALQEMLTRNAASVEQVIGVLGLKQPLRVRQQRLQYLLEAKNDDRPVETI